MSNKENNMTIQLALESIKRNIPCDNQSCAHSWYYENLDNGKGFQRVRECSFSNAWNPLVMIDKHRPSKLAVKNTMGNVILCWFHIMKTFTDNLHIWKIPTSLR